MSWFNSIIGICILCLGNNFKGWIPQGLQGPDVKGLIEGTFTFSYTFLELFNSEQLLVSQYKHNKAGSAGRM